MMSDFDYIATRNEVIEGAFRIVGALEVDQTLTEGMLQQGVRALQLLVKSWSNKHLFLWTFNQSSFNTIASTKEYNSTLDQTIIGLDKAWVVSDNSDLPLEVISYSNYEDIYNKESSSGRPTHIAFKPGSSPSVYLWPSPNDIFSIKLLCVTPLKDFDEASGSGDVPARFQRALKYGLAEDLFDEYPGPMNERQYVQNKAFQLFHEAKHSDVPIETTNEIKGLYGRRC